MKSVFLTGGARAKTLRHLIVSGQEILSVIVPKLTKSNNRFEEVVLTAIEFGIQVIPVTRDMVTSIVQKLKPECLISCGFPYLLTEETIQLSYSCN